MAGKNKDLPKNGAAKQLDVPEEKELTVQDAPEQTELKTENPKMQALDREMPSDINKEDCITVNGHTKLIKPTRLLYHRNRTSEAYRILDLYPLPDILAMDEGYLDPNRTGDQIVYDFMIAVTDDPKFVRDNYNEMTADDIYRAEAIFKRLNKIDEKEEALKNRQAKETNR